MGTITPTGRCDTSPVAGATALVSTEAEQQSERAKVEAMVAEAAAAAEAELTALRTRMSEVAEAAEADKQAALVEAASLAEEQRAKAVEAATADALADTTAAVEAASLRKKLQVAADREKALRQRVGELENAAKAAGAAAASEAEAELETVRREAASLREELLSAQAEAAARSPGVSVGGAGGAPCATSISEEAAGRPDNLGGGVPTPLAYLARLMACTPPRSFGARSGGRHSALRSMPLDDETLDAVHAGSTPPPGVLAFPSFESPTHHKTLSAEDGHGASASTSASAIAAASGGHQAGMTALAPAASST